MRMLSIVAAISQAGVALAANDAAERWVRAAGGCERLASIQSIYREAAIDVAGSTGTIRIWRTPDGRCRKEEQVAAYSLVETFDGRVGMIRMGANPPRTMTPAELARARSTSFANFAAVFFGAFPERRRWTWWKRQTASASGGRFRACATARRSRSPA
jgi:hypothetical protein